MIDGRKLLLKKLEDADSKATQKINLIGNLNWVEQTSMFFILEEKKEVIFDVSQGAVGV